MFCTKLVVLSFHVSDMWIQVSPFFKKNANVLNKICWHSSIFFKNINFYYKGLIHLTLQDTVSSTCEIVAWLMIEINALYYQGNVKPYLIFSTKEGRKACNTFKKSSTPWWVRWQCGRSGSDPSVGKIPLEKGMAADSSILARRIP